MGIREVAREAGVSVATVSRVLNRSGYVKAETYQRVIAAIRKLHYVPNGVARSMVRGNTRTIGLILPDITNPYFPMLARGVEDAATAQGYLVILCNTDNNPDTEAMYLAMLREKCVDGLVYVSAAPRADHVQEFAQVLPVVWVDRPPVGVAGDVVAGDDFLGGYLATRHLISLGRRRIAFISGPPGLMTSEERERGYRLAHKEAGLVPEDTLTAHGDFKFESGRRAMAEILGRTRPDALFAANDLMALGALEVILAAGCRVPEDIAVVGYDNIVFARLAKPALTSVEQPSYLIGLTACEVVLERIARRELPVQKKLFKPTLVVRASSQGEGQTQ
ncbi:MAG: LacI family transcriptional regulator [Bacillota bacterium]|jgi:LacI family transcriptional regulator|nr:LacI family transcriptional regulator [Bacillota bacterium]